MVLYRFLGNGLVTVTHYDEWSPKRRLYDPAFTKRSGKQLQLELCRAHTLHAAFAEFHIAERLHNIIYMYTINTAILRI